MKQILYFLLSTLMLLPILAKGQANSTLFYKIAKLDSLLFQEAFNKCETDILHKIIDKDFEMYHDQSGVLYGRDNFVKGIKNNICSIDYRPFRKLISSELEILKDDGNIYGILQNGSHEFYAIEENKQPYLTSTAEFSHLWMKKKLRKIPQP